MTLARTKRVVEDALIALGVDHLAMRRHRGQALVLAYHNIVPDDVTAGDRSLHVGIGRFREHVDALADVCDVVSVAEAMVAQGGSRPRVAITFDDAYLGALTHGLDVLSTHGFSSTVFVAPARLGGTFWWDALAGPSGLAESVRSMALDACGGDDARVRAWAGSVQLGTNNLPPDYVAATAEQLDAAVARHSGLTLASHSWSHPNLSALDGDTLAAELRWPLDWLRARYPGVPGWIAYPYGLASPTVFEAARGAGYEAGFLVTGGWMPRAPGAPLSRPRLNIPAGLSAPGFRLRLGRS